MTHSNNRPLRLGGVLYTGDSPQRNALKDFALHMKAKGWCVGGLIQEVVRDEQGDKIGLDAIDIITEARYPLARPSKEDREHGSCGFDTAALSETHPIFEKALNQNADLLIVEKFGEREQDGVGLADEILKMALSGIPTLVAVPANSIEKWNSFTGRVGNLLPHDLQSLKDWWPKRNLYRDLYLGVDDVLPTHIEIGQNCILIQGANGCGIIATPSGDIPDLTGLSLRDIALFAHTQETPQKRALGICAILAHYNQYDLKGPDLSGLAHFQNKDLDVLAIGNFPTLDRFLPDCQKIETENALHHLHDHAYEGLIIPAHTLSGGTLPHLLENKSLAETVLIGPETPLSPRLFDYGLNVLSGRIITNPTLAIELVRQGAEPKDLKSACRYITLSAC